MKAWVVHVRDPLNPAHARDIHEVRRKTRLLTWVKRRQLAGRFARVPVICRHNDQWIPRSRWHTVTIRDGDAVAFIERPAGRGSNPLLAVLSIALMIVAPYAGAAIAGTLGLGATAGTAIGGVIAVAGGMIVNAVLAPPKQSTAAAVADLAAPSPTYSLQAQGNQARLGQKIPEVFGDHLIYPDFAADPYAEFADNEQMLYQLFCVGRGLYDITDIKIEDTPYAVFPDVTVEVYPPGSPVTLFPAHVDARDEVSGQEALQGVAIGPFPVCDAGTVVNRIAYDIVCPGLYRLADDGSMGNMSVTWRIEYQAIDENGAAIGGWAILGHEVLSAGTNTPIRRTFSHGVTVGRYQARFIREDAKDTSARVAHALHWFGLRGYVPGTNTYGDVTLLAMRARASNNLSLQAARRVNVRAKRKLPWYAPGAGWQTPVHTRSIAWVAAYICKTRLPDFRIDLDQLAALDATWSSRGDWFDGVFDSGQGFWPALVAVLRCGRAQPIWQGGVVRFVRDEPRIVRTGVYSMRNIVRGSFQIDYALPNPDRVDGLTVEYFDRQVWKWRTVDCVLPGVTPKNKGKLRFFGATERAQVYREGMYMVASNVYRTRLPSLRSELEGNVHTPGDLISVSHDLPEWGQSGEVLSWESGTRNMRLSEPLTWTPGQTHYMQLRRRDGTPSGPYVVTPGYDAEHAICEVQPEVVDPGFRWYFDGAEERTHFQFGPGVNYARDCLVIGIEQRGDNQVQLACVVEDARVHAADGGTPPVLPPGTPLPPIPTRPVIPPGTLMVVEGGTPAAPMVFVAWQPAPGAVSYIVQYSQNASTEDGWVTIAQPTYASANFRVPAGPLAIRVAPVGVAIGDWVRWDGYIDGDVVSPAPPPLVIGITATPFLTTVLLEWTDITYLGADRVEIWAAGQNSIALARWRAAVSGPVGVWGDDVGQTGVTRYYWLRIISKPTTQYPQGQIGPFSAPVVATTGRVGSNDVGFGTSENHLYNSDFAASNDGWGVGGTLPGVQFGRNLAGWTVGLGTAYLVQPNAQAAGYFDAYGTDDGIVGNHIPIVGEGTYEFSGYTGAHRCAMDLGIAWYTAAGAYIGEVHSPVNNAEKPGGTTLDAYKRLWVIATAPASAAFATPFVRKYGTIAGNADSYAFFARLKWAVANPNQTNPSPWSPTGLTQASGDVLKAFSIVGAKIKSNEIAANHMKAGSITAANAAIADLTVGTLSIQDNAVTLAAYAEVSNPFIGGSPWQLVSAAINVGNGKVVVHPGLFGHGVNGPGGGFLTITRDGATIRTVYLPNWQDNYEVLVGNLPVVDAPGPGDHIYGLIWNTAGNQTIIQMACILLSGAKK